MRGAVPRAAHGSRRARVPSQAHEPAHEQARASWARVQARAPCRPLQHCRRRHWRPARRAWTRGLDRAAYWHDGCSWSAPGSAGSRRRWNPPRAPRDRRPQPRSPGAGAGPSGSPSGPAAGPPARRSSKSGTCQPAATSTPAPSMSSSHLRSGFAVRRRRPVLPPTRPGLGCCALRPQYAGTGSEFYPPLGNPVPADSPNPLESGNYRPHRSPKLMPARRAVCTTSCIGSTRFGSRSASAIGTVTMWGVCSATI